MKDMTVKETLKYAAERVRQTADEIDRCRVSTDLIFAVKLLKANYEDMSQFLAEWQESEKQIRGAN